MFYVLIKSQFFSLVNLQMPGKLADAGYAHAQIPSNIGETLNNKTPKMPDGKKIKKEQAWLRMIRGKTSQIAKGRI